MKIKIMDRAKKKKFIAGLSNLGMKKIPELLVRGGKEQVWAYSGDLATEQIMEIWRLFPIEGIGLHVGKNMVNRSGVREIRLSLDGMHVWEKQLTERIFILNESQEKNWFLGKNVELNDKQIGNTSEGSVLVKSADGKDFVGMGKVGNDDSRKGVPSKLGTSKGIPSSLGITLFSFLPKERRRKSQTI